jgi:exopolysaccharide production protein ExoQ
MTAVGHTLVYRAPDAEKWRLSSTGLAAGTLLLLAILFSLGVFEPKLAVTEVLRGKSTAAAVAAFSTPNPYNEVRWVVLLLGALWLAWKAQREVCQATLALWPLGLLLAFAMMSALWSDHPEVTFRRSAGLFANTAVTVICIAVLSRTRPAVLIVFMALFIALSVNLATLTMPVAFDSQGHFRGALGHKNVLGPIAASAVLIGLIALHLVKDLRTRSLVVLFLVLWGTVLALTVSKTAAALVLLTPAVYLGIDLTSRLMNTSFGMAAVLSLAICASVLGLAGGVLGYSPFAVVERLGGDPTFTNRTEIWNFMIAVIRDNILAGHGFGAVWGVGSEALNLSSPYNFIHKLNTGHNGYLDILAALGVVGLLLWGIQVLLFGTLAENMRDIDPIGFRFIWWVMIFFTLHNLLESSLAVPFAWLWTLAVIALALGARSAASPLLEPAYLQEGPSTLREVVYR